MGFTVEDMLIISREKYNMELIAGKNGWANSISWLLMAEDTIIVNSFLGKELVVTTGLGFNTAEKLIDLIKMLDSHHSAGLIINTGFHIKEVPKEVMDIADKLDLPLMTVPWEVSMAEMIKDLTVRIFMQTQTDEQLSSAFIKAIERHREVDDYRDDLSASFDVDGRFQVVTLSTPSLDSMDTVERKRISYRLQIYLENISHNAHFFYYNGAFLLILNAVDDEPREEILEGFLKRAKMRMPDQDVFVGVGSPVMDVYNLHLSYKRADYALKYAMSKKHAIERFDSLGLDRVIYSVADRLLLKEMGYDKLAPVLEYDERHDANLLETLYLYLKYNGSVSRVSDEIYIHKNTILYRMGKIKELLNTDLEDGEERMALYLAAIIVKEGLH